MTNIAPSVSNPVNNPAQAPNSGSSSTAGASPTVAAPSDNQPGRSYATAATNSSLATASSASSGPQSQGETLLQSRHAKSSSVSPANGKNMISPAVPAVAAPAIVNSSSMMNGGPAQTDHGRKPSVVTISAAGTSGYMPNGGPVTSNNRPNISFGSMSAASGSPAIANTVPYHSHNNSLSQPASNPRITSPANSPSPIPQPAASGGKPPAGLQGQGNGLNFGSMGGDATDMNMRSGSQIPLTPSHQPAHLRRDSSQSAHSEMGGPAMHNPPRHYPGSGRGRSGYGHGPYAQPMAHSPNATYRQLPAYQRNSQGFHPQYQGQVPMNTHQQPPYRATRSPAPTPAMMAQHISYPNNAQMPPFAYAGFPQHLQPQQAQNVYNMPPQYDPNYGYYQTPYGMHPGAPFQGAPPSPRPYNHVPPVAQSNYVHAQYPGGASTAQSMSRTPSAASERPGSTLSQPQTPAVPPGSNPAQAAAAAAAATQIPISGSPANKSNFAIPSKAKSKGIVITNPEGKVLNFNSKSTTPAPAPKSPVVVTSNSTPPPRGSGTPESAHTRTESKFKSDAEKKQDFQEQVKRQLQAEKAEAKRKDESPDKQQPEAEKAEQKAKETDDNSAGPAASDKAEDAKVPLKEDDGRNSAETEAAEKKRKEEEEAERLEREIAEMEEAERQREEAEEAYRVAKKKENEEKAKIEAAKADEALKRAEREAEEAEKARQNKGTAQDETAEEKAERENLFASLKKPTFGPGATTALSSGVGDSRASTPASDASPMPPPPPPASQQAQQQQQQDQSSQQQQNQQSKLPSSRHNKPAALKLETKPVEPAQPTPGMQALKSARFLQVKNESINYPDGFSSPNPALNMSGKRNGRQYDKSFLLQFQEVFKEKPSTDWDVKVKETVGESDSARPVSARASQPSRQNSRPSIPSGFSLTQMGTFGQGTRTMPSSRASTSGSSRTPTMNNPLATLANRPGGFPVGPPSAMSRNNSITTMGQGIPPSPRTGGSARGRNSRRGGPDKAPSRREEEQMQKAMPLTANQALKPLETSKTGWKPMSITQAAAPALLPSGHMPPDMVQRKVKAALNKMTPEKFEKISDQILEIAAQSKDETDGRTLRQVIALTFEKACDEAHWASMYAKFCKRMLETMSPEIKDANVRDKTGNPVVGGALFRKYLLTRCQEEFERGWEVDLPPKPEGQTEEAEMMSDEYYIAAAAKRRGLGLIQFIGELYKLGMLTLRIMHECVHKLLDFEGLPDESAIESLVKLLRTVGATMDSTEAGPKMTAVYFSRIETIMDMEGLPSRMRFMLMDTVDLRKSGWRTKDHLKGPKTIQEIHQEVAAQQQQADMERQRQNQKGAGRLPMGRGDARNFSGGMMPPPDYHRNVVAADELRKLSRGASGRNVSSGPATLGPSSMFASRSSSGRKGFGPAGLTKSNDESGASSRTGTPPVKDNKEKDSSSHANAFSALASLDGEGQDEASPASSPPTVKSKPNDVQPKSKLGTDAESQKK